MPWKHLYTLQYSFWKELWCFQLIAELWAGLKSMTLNQWLNLLSRNWPLTFDNGRDFFVNLYIQHKILNIHIHFGNFTTRKCFPNITVTACILWLNVETINVIHMCCKNGYHNENMQSAKQIYYLHNQA